MGSSSGRSWKVKLGRWKPVTWVRFPASRPSFASTPHGGGGRLLVPCANRVTGQHSRVVQRLGRWSLTPNTEVRVLPLEPKFSVYAGDGRRQGALNPKVKGSNLFSRNSFFSVYYTFWGGVQPERWWRPRPRFLLRSKAGNLGSNPSGHNGEEESIALCGAAHPNGSSSLSLPVRGLTDKDAGLFAGESF